METKLAQATGLQKQDEEVQKLTTRADAAKAYADKVQIENDADQEKVIKSLTSIEGEWKRGEGVRKFFVDPLNEQVKKINGLFKPSLDVLKDASTTIRRKLVDYQTRVAAKAEEAKAKVMKRVEKGTLTVETAVKKIENVKEAEKTVRTEEATVTYREQKKVVIEDPTKLPREYLIPDEVKIRKVALAGVEIPGVKVIVEKVPAIKQNNF